MADEERKGLVLGSQHWQVLAVGNTGIALRYLDDAFKYLQQMRYPTPEDMKALDEQWNNIVKNWEFIKTALRGWQIAAKNEGLTLPPQPAEATQQVAQGNYSAPPQTETPDAAFHVKQKGWPKGKPRGPRKPKAAQSSAAVLPPVTQ